MAEETTGPATPPAVYPGHAVAEKAFDVMVRRGWTPKQYDGGDWGVQDRDGLYPRKLRGWRTYRGVKQRPFTDPFTPLVEADAWLTKQEFPHGK